MKQVDLSPPVLHGAAPQVLITIPRLPFSASFNSDEKTVRRVLSDPLLQQEMFDGAITVCQETINQLVALLKQYDQRALSSLARPNGLKSVEREFLLRSKTVLDRQGAKASRAADKVWKDLLKAERAATQYRNQQILASGKNVVKVSMTGAVLGLGSGGPGSIFALVKACVALGRQIYELAIDAEKMGRKVSSGIRTLVNQYKNSKHVYAKEVGKRAFLALTGIELTSLERVQRHNTMYGGKLSRLYAKAHELAQSLYMLLDATTKVASSVDYDEQGRAHWHVEDAPSSFLKRRGRSKASWKRKQEQRIQTTDKAVKKTIDLHQETHVGLEHYEVYTQKLTLLEAWKKRAASQQSDWDGRVKNANRAGMVAGVAYSALDVIKTQGAKGLEAGATNDYDLITPMMTAFEELPDNLEASFQAISSLAQAVGSLVEALV